MLSKTWSSAREELEKISATLGQLEAGVSRIPGIIRMEHPITQMMGAGVLPTKAMLSRKNAKGAELMGALQRKVMGPNAEAVQELIRPFAEDRSMRGKILAHPNVGQVLHPGAAPQLSGDLDTTTLIHEALERKGTVGSGLHNLGTETKDFNLVSKLQGGPREEAVRQSMGELRAPEFEHLRGQLAEKFNDPRAAQFAEMGQRIPKAMRKAYSKEIAPTLTHVTPEKALEIGEQQTPVLMGRYRAAGMIP